MRERVINIVLFGTMGFVVTAGGGGGSEKETARRKRLEI